MRTQFNVFSLVELGNAVLNFRDARYVAHWLENSCPQRSFAKRRNTIVKHIKQRWETTFHCIRITLSQQLQFVRCVNVWEIFINSEMSSI